MEIVVFTREPGSGTRETFEEACLKPFGLEVRADASVRASPPSLTFKRRWKKLGLDMAATPG